MTDVRVGRLLIASLHQAIHDELPDRAEFYDHWLGSDAWRDGAVDLAALIAVLGFLRTEGEAYDRVVTRGGRLAAEWTVASMSGGRRRLLTWLPAWLRKRAALRTAVRVVRSLTSSREVRARVRQQSAEVRVTASVFCAVRERAAAPLCGFHLAAAVETFRQLGVAATGRVARCHAMDRDGCLLVVDVSRARAAEIPAIAA
jgi:hypothetical protein